MNVPLNTPLLSGGGGLDGMEPSGQPEGGQDPASLPGLDIRKLIGRTVRGLPWIAGGAAAGLALGFVALATLPAKYTASVSILIDPKRPDTLGADAAFANLFVDSGRVASVEQILVSSALLGKVVAKDHLTDNPALIPGPGLVRRLSAAIFDTPLPAPDRGAAARTEKAVELLAKSVRTTRVGVTYVIKVDVTAATAARAQLLAADIADAYLQDQLDTKYAAARHDAAWLNTRVRELRQAVMESEANVETIRQQYGLVQTESSPGATLERQSVGSLNADLTQAKADVAETGAKYNQVLRVARHGGNLEGLTAAVESKVVADLRVQQAVANRKLADLQRRFTANYPELQSAKADRDTVNAQIAAEVSRIVSGVRNDYETALSRRDALQADVDRLVRTTTAASSAKGRVALHEAEHVADANRQAYAAALTRLQEVEQQVTRQEAEARIISPAQLPAGPSFPSPPIFLGGGFALGLFAGFGMVFLRPRLQGRLTDPEDARALLHLPILAMTPSLSKAELRDGRTKLTIPDYLLAQPISLYAESLRMLRLKLQNAAGGANVIQITSSVPGEGKSTLAASMAASAASVGKRTILVDLDLYNPAVGRMFGEQGPEGIAEAILEGNAGRFVTRAHDYLPFYVISSGAGSPPRPDLIEHERLPALIADLAENYDLVILDTPPVLAISDPVRISGLCHATIMVVAWSDTQRDMVEQAVIALRAAGAPLAGLVLNKVDLKKTGMYGGKTYVYKPYSSG